MCPFWIFKTTRNKLSLLPVFVAFGVEMNTWIAEPWSTGDTLPPPAQRWTVLGPPHAFMAENGRCWTPFSSLCALYVFLPLLLGYNYLETWLSLGQSSLKWRALAFVGEVLWQWWAWVRVSWFPNSLLWAVTTVLPEAFPWEEIQLSYDPEMSYWSSREALAWPREALPTAWWVRGPLPLLPPDLPSLCHGLG